MYDKVITMKRLLTTNWHFMRLFRFAIAMFCFYTAFEQREWTFVLFGLFFLLQAVFNLGCGPRGCNVPLKKKNDE